LARIAVSIASVASCPLLVLGDGFLKQDPHASRSLLGNRVDFQEAMASVMGCGGGSDTSAHLAAVSEEMAPMWRSLPKDGTGQVEWRSMRYLAHRYFLKQSSLLIRGLEPARQVNDSHLGTAEILNDRIPSLVESVLEGKRTNGGFSRDDAVVLLATMERLIYDSESTLLETVYTHERKAHNQELSHQDLFKIIESYMVYWMLQGDEDVVKILLANRTLLAEEVPHWDGISGFANGMIKSVEYSRMKSEDKFGHGNMLMDQKYTFDDAHEIVAGITKSFASYWESECQMIKSSLIAFDKKGIGRVRLADFYGANSDGEWRFGESEEYLRELGALDESMGEKQVIIPNYIQGASNCIVTSQHYFVCCQSECEHILNEIEDAIDEPVALPEQIIAPLENMTDLDDEAPKLTQELRSQLQRIADTHGGKVPLHGRLFAQWLHYVFPRECPFPHKVGTSTFKSPIEYGESFVATTTEVQSHAARRNDTNWQTQMVDEERLMAQWSEDEELIADYSLALRAPWQTSRVGGFTLAGLALLLLGTGAVAKVGTSSNTAKFNMGYEPKAHFV